MAYQEPLQKAFKQLEKAFSFAASEEAEKNPEYGEQFRNSAIQCFEFTYESCWKTLRRTLMEDASSPGAVSIMGYKELIRLAGEKGYIQNVDKWFLYREKRNLTSHTYNEDEAKEVFGIIPDFISDVRFLIGRLQ